MTFSDAVEGVQFCPGVLISVATTHSEWTRWDYSHRPIHRRLHKLGALSGILFGVVHKPDQWFAFAVDEVETETVV
jgi:hypothetical protein